MLQWCRQLFFPQYCTKNIYIKRKRKLFKVDVYIVSYPFCDFFFFFFFLPFWFNNSILSEYKIFNATSVSDVN